MTTLPPIRSDIPANELSACIATACGIPITPAREEVDVDSRTIYEYPAHFKPYATSLDAVLGVVTGPTKEYFKLTYSLDDGQYWEATIGSNPGAFSSTAARAVCFALYRAKGGTVTEVSK